MLTYNKRNQLEKALKQANTYAEWLTTAEKLDALEGLIKWRRSDDSSIYHASLMRTHIRQMQALRQNNNLIDLATLLEESMYRHLGELNNPELYQDARSGTKYIVTEYLDEVERALRTLCDQPTPNMPERRKLMLFEQAERIYGRPALMLSGGAAFGVYHLGVVKALWEQSLLPQTLAGSSMGAVVAAAVCNRSDAEVDLFFRDQMNTVHREMARWRSPRDMWQHRSAMDEKLLLESIIANVGSATFSEAFQRSGRILNITVSPTRTHQKPRVLNYMTAPNVLVEYAVLASCAVPLLFPPVALQARGADGRPVPYMSTETWIDGAMRSDLPQDRLARLHNINQTIVSQANPFVIPFITHRQQSGVRAFGKYVLASLIHTGSAELLGIGRQLFGKTRLSPVLDRAHAIAAQNYLGDINIRFPFKPKAYLKVLATPNSKELTDYIRLGEHATWPQIPMIHDLTRISRVFLECIETIRAKMDQTAQVEDGF